jgi:CheY-like chemotaxis protein
VTDDAAPVPPGPVSGARPAVLFVDDELDNVEVTAGILADALDIEVLVVPSVEEAVALLQSRPIKVVVMDLFIPLGDHPHRVLGPRARRYQEAVEHIGGLVLLEEIERLEHPPVVIAHTACTDAVLHELFGDVVTRRIPKPAPVDTLLMALMEILAEQ